MKVRTQYRVKSIRKMGNIVKSRGIGEKITERKAYT
jgi:hypothetical protein